MQRIIKIFLAFIFIWGIMSRILTAQSTSSPYSMFGLGVPEEQSTGFSKAMGGTGIGIPSRQYLNLQNPASYAGLDSLLSIFEVGIFGKYTNFATKTESQSLLNANLKYILMGFRLTRRISTSFGFAPYSSIGYNINSTSPLLGSNLTINKSYTGEGGVNQVYLGGSIKIIKNLSLGVNAAYLFGNVTHSESGSGLTYTLKDVTYVSNINLKYGINYNFAIKNTGFGLGVIYTNGKNLSTSNETSVTTGTGTTQINSRTHNFRIPQDFGAGIYVGKGFFLAGADFERSLWKGTKFENPLVEARNSDRISVGVEFPSLGINKGTTRMIIYRLGAEYKGSPYIIQGAPINYYGITMGAGLPLKGVTSVMNVSLELGQNGVKAEDLFKESFVTVHLDLALRDLWFRKHRYE